MPGMRPAYLALTVGLVWPVCLVYVTNYDSAVSSLGELTLRNPIVVVVLHSPAIAAFDILLAYDGPRAVLNFLRTLVPQRQDWAWRPVLAVIMLAYVFAVRFGHQPVGIPVPTGPMAPGGMLVGFVQLLWREVGMPAICLGRFGFLLPLMHK